jgi:hypothetical protein
MKWVGVGPAGWWRGDRVPRVSSRATAGPRASPVRQGRSAELLYRVGDFKCWARSRSRDLRRHRPGLNGPLCGWHHCPRVLAQQGCGASGAEIVAGGGSVGSQCRLLF